MPTLWGLCFALDPQTRALQQNLKVNFHEQRWGNKLKRNNEAYNSASEQVSSIETTWYLYVIWSTQKLKPISTLKLYFSTDVKTSASSTFFCCRTTCYHFQTQKKKKKQKRRKFRRGTYYLNCLIKSLWIRSQKSSTVLVLDDRITGSS